MRSYAPAIADLRAKVRGRMPLDDRMRAAVETYWRYFGGDGPGKDVSWVGCYIKTDGADELTLVCREPKPACSPIGLQGMCGRGWKDRRAYAIPDIRTLGENYIACDPKDKSEVVAPIFDARGTCVGVFDVDSYSVRAFTLTDCEGAIDLLSTAGLCRREWLAATSAIL